MIEVLIIATMAITHNIKMHEINMLHTVNLQGVIFHTYFDKKEKYVVIHNIFKNLVLKYASVENIFKNIYCKMVDTVKI